MVKVFTDVSVRKYKTQSKRREIADGGKAGLYLVIQPTGAKSWAFRFRSGGKSVKITLGGYDETARAPIADPKPGADLTLAEARLVVARLDHERAGGTDVVVARKVARLPRDAKRSMTPTTLIPPCFDATSRSMQGRTSSAGATTRGCSGSLIRRTGASQSSSSTVLPTAGAQSPFVRSSQTTFSLPSTTPSGQECQ
jgi:hypothetical protein